MSPDEIDVGVSGVGNYGRGSRNWPFARHERQRLAAGRCASRLYRNGRQDRLLVSLRQFLPGPDGFRTPTRRS